MEARLKNGRSKVEARWKQSASNVEASWKQGGSRVESLATVSRRRCFSPPGAKPPINERFSPGTQNLRSFHARKTSNRHRNASRIYRRRKASNQFKDGFPSGAKPPINATVFPPGAKPPVGPNGFAIHMLIEHENGAQKLHPTSDVFPPTAPRICILM